MSLVKPLDRRLTPARADLAAARLHGLVEAERFVEAIPMRVVVPVLDLRPEPDVAASVDTQALFGETASVYDVRPDGWAWGQLDRDGYVGWMRGEGLSAGRVAPTHQVTALRAPLFERAAIKSRIMALLSFSTPLAAAADVTVAGRAFLRLATGGYVVADHAGPLDAVETDPVAVAERFLGAPYVWGGRSSLGLDCSGLVQTAFRACGVPAPRDSDMQEDDLGTAIGHDPSEWRRGDLLFWPGHVALVRDADTILHANAHAMAVSVEPTTDALARIEAAGSPLRSVKRVW